MQVFHFCLALGPVTVYLLLLGMLNLSRRPFLVAGTRDATALGLALSGLVIVGPLALLFPHGTALQLGRIGTAWIWLLMLALYGLCLILVLLTLRPRLVIYNIAVDQLRPLLAEFVERLDPDARWAGDSLVLPSLGAQFHLEALPWMRNVSLVSAGPNQDYGGWRKLEGELAAALRHVEVQRNPMGMILMSLGVCLAAVLAAVIARDPLTIARTLYDILAACWDMTRGF